MCAGICIGCDVFRENAPCVGMEAFLVQKKLFKFGFDLYLLLFVFTFGEIEDVDEGILKVDFGAAEVWRQCWTVFYELFASLVEDGALVELAGSDGVIRTPVQGINDIASRRAISLLYWGARHTCVDDDDDAKIKVSLCWNKVVFVEVLFDAFLCNPWDTEEIGGNHAIVEVEIWALAKGLI